MHHHDHVNDLRGMPRDEMGVDPSIVDRLRKACEEITRKESLGATGNFPQGQFGLHDEGQLRLAVTSDKDEQKVIINFGKPIAFIGFSPEQAIDLGNLILKHARKIRS